MLIFTWLTPCVYQHYKHGVKKMRKISLIAIIMLLSASAMPVNFKNRIKISDDLEIIRISRHSYIHVSYASMPGYGRFGSNGYIFVNNNEAVLFDTPVTDALTKELTDWISDTLKARIIAFIPNHYHNDCMGGLNYIHSLKIPSYANDLTIAIAKSKNLPVPQNGFKDTLTLKAGNKTVICRYFGAGHSADNITAWVPSEKVLFAGCMVKDLNSKSLGNLSDAVISEWPGTIDRVISGYRDAQTVIPGHGDPGGIDLLLHTKKLLDVKK